MITVHECPLASSEGKERGGINVYTFELSKALSRLGWSVDAFTRIQDDVNPRTVQVNKQFRVIHLPNGPHTHLSKKEVLANLPEFTKNLVDFMKKEGVHYDVFHAHYYLSGIVASQLRSGSRLGGRDDKSKIVMTFHTLGLLKQLVARSKDTDDPIERIPLERELAADADRLIASSETGREYLTTLYDVPKEKIATIPPGVDTTIFRPLPRQSAKRHIGGEYKDRIILAAGRIDPVKGFDVLLVALKMLLKRNAGLSHRLCLCIVGGDVEQNQNQWSRELKNLEALRAMLNLTAMVRFVPAQPQSELPYYYNAADVVVMPSHYESFGMVALEAIACSTPVIATEVTGISPLLNELPQGHIVSANNPIALSQKIEHVLSLVHRRVSQRNFVAAFDWMAIARRIANEYEKVAR